MKTCALTFDDGPSAWTEPLLDLLGKHGARATFFVLGSHVAGLEPIVAREILDGHELAVHGWNHVPVDDLHADEIGDGLARTVEAVGMCGQTVLKWWRPPWSLVTVQAAAAASLVGLSYCGVTLDGRDVSRSHDQIVQTVYNGIADRAVVGLHDGIANNGEQIFDHRENTVRAVERILATLTHDYRFVTVSELLG